jgi:hypothetical protein
MKRIVIYWIVAVSALVAASAAFHFSASNTGKPAGIDRSALSNRLAKAKASTRAEKKAAKARKNKGRQEHWFRLLRDPETNAVPKNIRERELEFARQLPTREGLGKRRQDQITEIRTWKEAGPIDVGGRVRALALDPRNTSIILAGGVNGGMWRSTNNGSSWTMRTPVSENLSTIAVAQDPTNRNTWYYAMGEYLGSDSDRGFLAYFFGSGLFKSTDNGVTWNYLAKADTKFPVTWDSDFHYTTDIKVSPLNGNVFLGSVGSGLLRSTDGASSFTGVLGNGLNDHEFVEFDIAPSGRIAAALSLGFSEAPATTPGIYVSDNSGNQWTNITPASFPDTAGRALVRFAPSNANILYAIVNAGPVTEDRDSVLFYKFTRSNEGVWTSENRTANLPRFGGAAGDMLTQFNYNMTLAVKPDDPDFVIIGFTNLYRSKDGFATKVTSKLAGWIGGYTNTSNSFNLYPNHHPDQHAFLFDPFSPLKAWSAHDGGLSYTDDISATPVVWTSKNNGFNVTQFYTVAQKAEAGNNELVGGTQDNGSPYFEFDGSTTLPSVDVSSGDGSYAHYGSRYLYTSSQLGWIDQYDITTDNWSYSIHPDNASGDQLFIHPFAVNPNNDSEMVYPDGRTLWVNSTLDLSNKQTGWNRFTPTTTVVPNNYVFTALAYTTVPAGTVYAAAYRENSAPRLVVFNTQTKTFTQKTITGAPSGGYPHAIAVNPADGNELLVVFSNYNVASVFHSTDGGTTFTSLEGNLAGTTANPGPSVRSAGIIRRTDGTKEYFVGTSVGLCATTVLNGNSTVWARESDSGIGTAIVEALSARNADGRIAAATHGRGIFVGNVSTGTASEREQFAETFQLLPAYPNPFNPGTTVSVILPGDSRLTVTVVDLNGRVIATLADGNTPHGTHRFAFNAPALSSGVYIVRAQSAFGTVSQKITLVK